VRTPSSQSPSAGTGPSRTLLDRTAVVTGAGAGLGRAEAIALAEAGARVVVNDVDADLAAGVATLIREAGGEAVSVAADVAEWSSGRRLLRAALDTFGDLHIVVNNAGVVRERMIFNLREEEYDAVLGVHLKGHFAVLRAATAYWRDRAKTTGEPVYARVVNTASEAYLTGAPAQPNYAAAKAGIVALTLSVARGCARYGVRANAICPRARTAMTDAVFAPPPDGGPDPMSADHVTPLVHYLASPEAEHVNGQVFVVYDRQVAVLAGPSAGARFAAEGPWWHQEELAAALGHHFAAGDRSADYARPAPVLTP
jgi:NAD(P)-dependent dehydrogenase (short-subunit alcohol dehydrogenase family)